MAFFRRSVAASMRDMRGKGPVAAHRAGGSGVTLNSV
jgi:hypothetical protein